MTNPIAALIAPVAQEIVCRASSPATEESFFTRGAAAAACPMDTMRALFETLIDGALAKGVFMEPEYFLEKLQYRLRLNNFTMPGLFGAHSRRWPFKIASYQGPEQDNVKEKDLDSGFAPAGRYTHAFADFDPDFRNRANDKRKYFTLKELVFGFDYLARHPHLYMGQVLLLEAYLRFGQEGQKALNPTLEGSKSKHLNHFYGLIEMNSLPEDLYLRLLAIPVHAKARDPRFSARQDISLDDIRLGQQWFHHLKTLPNGARCPFSGHLGMTATLPLFKGTPREHAALLAFSERAALNADQYAAWQGIRNTVATHFHDATQFLVSLIAHVKPGPRPLLG